MADELKNYLDEHQDSKVCILDNNIVEFMNKLKNNGISTDLIFNQYDIVIIPSWVAEEINDSVYRKAFIEELKNKGILIYEVEEKDYIYLVNGEELNILNICLFSVGKVAVINSYIRKEIIGGNNLDDIDYEYKEWIEKLYNEWPMPRRQITRSNNVIREQKKNAGEISITIIANILSYYYPNLKTITLMTYDKDCYDYVKYSEEKLLDYKGFLGRENSKITFKSNDVILFELVNKITSLEVLKEIINMVRMPRKVRYSKQKEDMSFEEYIEVVDNNKLLEIIEDTSLHIIF